MRKSPILLVILFLGACAIIPQLELDNLYGTADHSRYELPVTATQQSQLEFHQDIKPILNNRCVVCHGCYDAPCQLNLASYEGLSRGASKELVYNGTRILASNPTRLFVDGETNVEWRNKGFYPVLNERSAEGDSKASVLSRILALKYNNKQILDNKPLPQDKFDFTLDRAQYCPTVAQMSNYERTQPHGGMPYGLPALSEKENNTLNAWISSGAPATANHRISRKYIEKIQRWETFLNGDSLKTQIMARYIYEHLFLANLYFDVPSLPSSRQFFKLVRSATPPGVPIELIATRRPFDDPGVARVYYRIRPVYDTILFKTHMPYALNKERMAKFKRWFIDENFKVDHLPSYDATETSNPFITFAQIPANSRYKFLLEEARFTIMGFIKGAVCRGQIALNVINDHFWVVFAKPEEAITAANSLSGKRLVDATYNLRLPADSGSTAGISNWLQYAKYQMQYLEAKSKYLNEVYKDGFQPTLDLVWDGEGSNKNAALTIFRHFDTASVEYGFIGENPQTMWLIGYPLLEKIHYLLVAGFDVYGNYGHQLKTRLYMDFLRMEGESNFVGLLPKTSRKKIVNQWYQEEPETTENYFNNTLISLNSDSGITYQTSQHYIELQEKLTNHLSSVLDNKYKISNSRLPATSQRELEKLGSLSGKPVSFLPQVSFITVEDNGKEHYFTLIHNNAHTNVSHIFSEEDRRVPRKDTLTLAYGFIGAYPNVYIKVDIHKLALFTDSISALSSQDDYRRLLDQYGIRRTHNEFWNHSDKVHRATELAMPIEHGLLDYNRLENR